MKEVTCNKCGWVHMALPIDQVPSHGYDVCFNCANTHKDFRSAVEADAPAGVTLQPILEYTDE